MLPPRAQRWLKAFHIVFASMWFGGALLLNVKQFFVDARSDGELFGTLKTMVFVDWSIIVPGALGVLVTGLVYSIWTQWGWFKHRWITVKWAICIFGVIFGTYPLGPWLEEMMRLAGEHGLAALSHPDYEHCRSMLMIFGSFQGLTIGFAMFVSTLKPWRQRRQPAPT